MQADVIIVGAGSAGCVLAERLSASGRRRVLLVEAGGPPSSPFVKIPAGFAKLFKSKLDWAYESAPQAHANGRRIFVPRGKMLGGCANMNAQIHQWCHPADFDGWAETAPGWAWSDVAPAFRRMERVAAPSEGRGDDGPMRICENPHVHPASRAFVAAARRVIGGEAQSYNGAAFEGAWIAEMAHDKGARFSIYDAYLKPGLQRANLAVLSGAEAEEIVFDNGRAVGVRVRTRAGPRSLVARAGVVLAAGAFGSPCLLMRSGFGPAANLRALGIEARRDAREVGANLQDHPVVALSYATPRKDTYKNAETPLNLLRYLLQRRGPLASNAIEAVAFSCSAPELAAADIELLFGPFEWRNEGLDPPAAHAFTIAAAVVAPLSRGAMRLGPGGAPIIDFGLFSDAEGKDRAAFLAAIRLARRIAASAPLAQEIAGEVSPGATAQTDEALFAWACETLQTVYHPTSTCRMGGDDGAVVTPKLELRGADRLWVVDASVMPSVPRGHPNAVVAMIAERAAGFIEQRLTAQQVAPPSANRCPVSA